MKVDEISSESGMVLRTVAEHRQMMINPAYFLELAVESVFRFHTYCFQLVSCLYCHGTASLCVGCTFKIHDKLKEYEKHSPSPVLHSASCLAEDVSVIFFQCINLKLYTN